MTEKKEYGRFTALMALRLAAPHTWAASTMPVFLGAALSLSRGGGADPLMLLSMLAVCILMQSCVNCLNDYSDFIRGTDTPENSPDSADAVLVYANPDPKKALLLGFLFLAAAACLGIPAVLTAGPAPLVIGMVGGIVILLYSFGRTPLSYLPLGELTSGFVMGGLIPLAVYDVLAGRLETAILLYALPEMLGIALIMMTNNSCDIGRDTEAGRKTLPVLLGGKSAARLYRALLILWAALPEALLLVSGGAAVLYPAMLIAALPALTSQLRLDLSPVTRGAAMGGITSLNIMLGLIYIAALLFGALV